MNGGPTLHWLPSLSNVSFASQTLVNQSNVYLGIESKLGELGGGPHSYCMNSVGLERATMIVFIRNKLCLQKYSLRNSWKRSKSSTFSMVLRSRLSSLSAMTRCLTMKNDTNLMLNTLFGTTSSCTPRQHGNRWSSKSRLALSHWSYASRLWPNVGC
jgi:hypothetical protein